jgi:dihydroflavonol-4-reductase
MKVLVTGGSGFVGSHIIRALVDGGHDVVAHVRSEERLRRALALHGSPSVQVARGQVTEEAAVREAARGADAVIHCAAVYSTDPRRAREIRQTNVEGTRTVLHAAVEAGCDPVVHVSSITALYPMKGKVTAEGPDAPPLGTSRFPYARSKRASDQIARALQAQGAPVVTTYPGGVYGPCDPGPGEQLRSLAGVLGNRFPFILPGGKITAVDVRWVADAHVSLIEPEQGPRRVLMGGHCVTWDEYMQTLRSLTGRRLPQFLYSPKAMTWLTGLLVGALQHLVPFRLPFSHEMAMFTFYNDATDDSVAEALAGPPPPLERTLADTLRWLGGAGHLPTRVLGRLDTDPPKALRRG